MDGNVGWIRKIYYYYCKKWDVQPHDFLWIMFVFAATGILTVTLREILTPYIWGETRNWLYYLTMPPVFISIYYACLLSLGILLGYKRIFLPMVQRPLVWGRKLRNWLARRKQL